MYYCDLFGRVCDAPTDCGYGWRPKRGDIRDELRALRAWMAKRDKDPWHGFNWSWRVYSESADAYVPVRPAGFRTPSPEMLAMQAGRAAYGQPARVTRCARRRSR